MAGLFYQAHRFGDNVALCFADSKTVYISHAQAAELARVLQAAAADVIARPFTASLFATHLAELPQQGADGRPLVRGYHLARGADGRAIDAEGASND